MTDQELIEIYNLAYKEEFDHHFEIVNSFYEPARDKKYAIELGIGIIGLVLSFRNGSELEVEIANLFEHVHKLGGSVADCIREIPNSINSHKFVAEEWHKTNKKEISTEFKKFLGIPYAIKQIHVKGVMRMGSVFERLNSLEDISKELGRKIALIDLFSKLKDKYEKLNGEITPKQIQTLPIQYEPLLELKSLLEKNDVDAFFTIIQSFFAGLSYNMKVTEGYFQSHIHMLLKLLHFNIESEIDTNKGRIDSVIETGSFVHIVEFKLNSSRIALEQIEKKEYYQRYLNSKKKIIMIGVGVDAEKKNIIDWKVKNYN
ncbi:MAG TPA: PD-(D/E)XK nuclease domain-containing protein [Flavobacteriales bacterium]|nr:PD-(D/E)XK nuclease domain-containing protein [Flavobacteriales bacterium]